MPALSQEAVSSALAKLSDWEQKGDEIRRTLTFKDFNAAIAFVNRLAAEAASANHHPDIDIRYNKVTIALTTHDEGGISSKDIELAEALDRLA